MNLSLILFDVLVDYNSLLQSKLIVVDDNFFNIVSDNIEYGKPHNMNEV